MKIQLIILLIFTYFSSEIVCSQTTNISKGKAKILTSSRIQLLGKTKDYLVYKNLISSGYSFNVSYYSRSIIIVDLKTLDIIHEIDISQFTNEEELRRIELINDHIVAFTYRKKLKKKPVAIKAYLFNINAPLTVEKEIVLFEFEEDREAQVYYDQTNSKFIVSNGIQHKWFSIYLNPLPDYTPQNNDPLPVKYKKVEKVTWKYFEKPEETKFFYPFDSKNDLRFYVKSEFVPESQCKIGYGCIRNLELLSYDTVKNFRKDNYKFDLREESYLLDYTVSLAPDGRFVIIGAYQDKEIKDGNIKFGLFCKIIESDMRDIIPTYYKEFVSVDSSIDFMFDHNYVYSYFSFMEYYILDIHTKNNYLSRFVNVRCPNNKYQYIQFNKQTAEISFVTLLNPSTCTKREKLIDGYLIKKISDSTEIIFFSDHFSNLGLGSDDSILQSYGNRFDSITLAFICYETKQGFGKRQKIYDAGTEGFLPSMNYNETYFSEIDSEGKFIIIVPTYNNAGRETKFYKIEVDL